MLEGPFLMEECKCFCKAKCSTLIRFHFSEETLPMIVQWLPLLVDLPTAVMCPKASASIFSHLMENDDSKVYGQSRLKVLRPIL